MEKAKDSEEFRLGLLRSGKEHLYTFNDIMLKQAAADPVPLDVFVLHCEKCMFPFGIDLYRVDPVVSNIFCRNLRWRLTTEHLNQWYDTLAGVWEWLQDTNVGATKKEFPGCYKIGCLFVVHQRF